ncbi:MarR family transcriptional regulator [Mucilaginibacter sp. dw_454]|uniref:MarR family winged helix-turn-helix transcriptional regulator n=1 Tax=Mucilaginibacter sp. dw_454 TaxID=2720079 RepID=UPI001BD20FC7|nr:MarR family transcriptional regulator [Mucilaginibacter sp. dw_454]
MKHVQLISQKLNQINNLYKKILVKELSAMDLDQHFEVLLILATHDEPLTQNKLASLLQKDKSRIVNIIVYLEQRNMVYTVRNPADRREHYVYLSSSARDSVQHITHTIEKINHLAEAGIDYEKLSAFFEVSELMQENLQKVNAGR